MMNMFHKINGALSESWVTIDEFVYSLSRQEFVVETFMLSGQVE